MTLPLEAFVDLYLKIFVPVFYHEPVYVEINTFVKTTGCTCTESEKTHQR